MNEELKGYLIDYCSLLKNLKKNRCEIYSKYADEKTERISNVILDLNDLFEGVDDE